MQMRKFKFNQSQTLLLKALLDSRCWDHQLQPRVQERIRERPIVVSMAAKQVASKITSCNTSFTKGIKSWLINCPFCKSFSLRHRTNPRMRDFLQMYFALSTFIRKGKLFSSNFTLKASLPLVLLLLSTKFLSLFCQWKSGKPHMICQPYFFIVLLVSRIKRSSKQKDEARALPISFTHALPLY